MTDGIGIHNLLTHILKGMCMYLSSFCLCLALVNSYKPFVAGKFERVCRESLKFKRVNSSTNRPPRLVEQVTMAQHAAKQVRQCRTVFTVLLAMYLLILLYRE